jgi:hypothetical protein
MVFGEPVAKRAANLVDNKGRNIEIVTYNIKRGVYTMKQTALIIDGNRLEHFYYDDPEDYQAEAWDEWLLDNLEKWFKNQRKDSVLAELCLDKDRRHLKSDTINLPPLNDYDDADEVIIDRVRQHIHKGLDCIVVTFDTKLKGRVIEEGGHCIRPEQYDFEDIDLLRYRANLKIGSPD